MYHITTASCDFFLDNKDLAIEVARKMLGMVYSAGWLVAGFWPIDPDEDLLAYGIGMDEDDYWFD